MIKAYIDSWIYMLIVKLDSSIADVILHLYKYSHVKK